MTKSADAFRTISEVAEWMDTPAHVLRFWESKFTQVKPVKRAGGRRYYRPADMRLLGGIKKLLHEDGMTIKGVQKILREQGIKHVSSLCALKLGEEEEVFEEVTLADVPASEPVDTVVPFSKPEEPPAPELVEAEPEPEPTDPAAEAEQSEAVEVAEAESTPEPEPAEEDGTLVLQVTTEDSAPDVAAEAPAEPAESDDAEMTPLPGFLQKSMEDRAEDEHAQSAPATVAPQPAGPSALVHLAKITALSPDDARQIAPLVEKLRARAG